MIKRIGLRVLVLLVPTVSGIWIGTQWVAGRFGYHPLLGVPLIELGRVKLYAPWQYGVWLSRYGWQQPEAFSTARWMVLGGVMVGMMCLLITTLIQGAQGQRGVATTYGSSVWADGDVVRRSKLL